MSEALKPGDVVQLNSAGPDMTVSVVRDDGVVDVEWFVGDDLRRTAFPATSLKRVDQWISTGVVRFYRSAEPDWRSA